MRTLIQNSEARTGKPLTVAIVGLGFSGAAAAAALLSEMRFPFSLILIDANGSLGAGLAYGKAFDGELLNVRARDLSLLAAERGDFAAWLKKTVISGDSAAPVPDLGQIFAPRAVFGDYVRERLFASFRARPDVSVQLVAEDAVGISRSRGKEIKIKFAHGPSIACDAAILAMGYGTGKAARRFGEDPFVKTLPVAASRAEKNVLVGSSLTMVDALMRLRRVNRHAHISVISRSAQIPYSQLRHSPAPVKFNPPDALTASGLLAAIRDQCRDAIERGESWQAVINGIRNDAQGLWAEAPISEQRRILRRLKTWWDIHRHRVPADIHAALVLEFASDRTEQLAGEVIGVSGDGPFRVSVRRRGEREITGISADLVFDCSGWRPDISAPLFRDLFKRGLACPDPHGLGLSVNRDGLVRTPTTRTPIFAVGPLCIGSLFEITAAPEIAVQAGRLAASINAEVKLTREVSNSVSRSEPGR